MSRMRVTAAQILADCPMVVGFGGWGVLGSALPSTGEHGPSVGYQWIDPIADANKEIWIRITTQPSAGTLLMLPDSSFEYSGESTTFAAQLAVDAADVGTPQTVTVTVGAEASVSSDLAGAYAVRGSVSSDLSGEYAVRGSVSADRSGTFSVRSEVSRDLSGGWTVRGAVSSDCTGGYLIRGSVSGDLPGSYQVGDGYSISPSQAALLYNLYRLHGLAEPLTVSPSLREVASLQQQVTSLGGATTIETISLPVETPLNPGLLVEELAALHGLTAPLTVTSEGRTAGAIVQSFSSAGNLTVITRQ